MGLSFHTNLSIDECTTRLASTLGEPDLFPLFRRFRSEEMFGTVNGHGFTLQTPRSYYAYRFGVRFKGKLVEEQHGTKIEGEFSPTGETIINIVLIPLVLCALLANLLQGGLGSNSWVGLLLFAAFMLLAAAVMLRVFTQMQKMDQQYIEDYFWHILHARKTNPKSEI